MAFVFRPAFALRHISPCADKRQTFRECVNIAIGPVNALDLPREPVFADVPVLVEIRENEYTYSEVPAAEWKSFQAAESLGSHYNKHIKDVYGE